MSDFTLRSQSEWIEMAERFYGRLISLCREYSSSHWGHHTPYLGWTARDVLAHMASAVPINFCEVLDRARRGDPSPPPEFDTFARNSQAVDARRRTPIADLIQELETEIGAILRVFAALSEAEWLGPAWFFVGPVRVRTLFLVMLGDDLFHERDLLVAAGAWRGMDRELMDPLADWFMREFRTAGFRSDRAGGTCLTGLYRLHGPGSGEWTMQIADGRCAVVRGRQGEPDFIVEAEAEDLIGAGLARVAPWIGWSARQASLLWPPSYRERVVAHAAGRTATTTALLSKRIRVSGNQRAAAHVVSLFWHFWERTEQTEKNIQMGTRGI